ncbi:MAG: choice-of-anchor L domain-containing protein [Bacteroidota bacterium]
MNIIKTFKMLNLIKYLAFILILTPLSSKSQLVLGPAQTPTQLVNNVLVGAGITVSNVVFTGSTEMISKFSNGNTTNLGLGSGVVLCTGKTSEINQEGAIQMSDDVYQNGDTDLDAIISSTGKTTQDAAILTFDFIPQSDTLKFRYIFGSEEYPEFVCSEYNDVFAFFVSGPKPAILGGGNYVKQNIALIPNTTTPVAINSINSGTIGDNGGDCTKAGESLGYSSLYVNNSAGQDIVFDGFTKVLTAWCLVTPCQQYSIKIAIADVGDGVWDSGVFLEANSFTSNGVAVTTAYANTDIDSLAVEGCNSATINFTLQQPAVTNQTITYTVSGTATNGVDYTSLPGSIVIPAGQSTASIIIDPSTDALTEGIETVFLDVQTSICGTTRYTVFIKDKLPIIANCSNDVNICNNASAPISVTASGGFKDLTYAWSNNLGSGVNYTVNPTISTTYLVTVSDICGQSAIDSLAVNVYKVSVDAGQNVSICNGESITLTATSQYATSTPSYKWSTNELTAAITVNPTITTTYYVTATAGACTAQDFTKVIVNQPPTVTADNKEICIGESSTVTAHGALTYEWNNNLGTGNNLQVSPTTTTSYIVTGTDIKGCKASATATITINPLPTITVNNPTICEGENAVLTAQGADSYTWSDNWFASNPRTVSPSSTTTYNVSGTDVKGCKNDTFVIVTVNVLPTVTVNNPTVCPGSSAIITASGATTYNWDNGLGIGNDFDVTPTATTAYTVTGTDENGCTDKAVSTVTISTSLSVTVNNPTICIGESATLTAQGAPNYVWSDNLGNGNGKIVTPTTTTLYQVSGSDNNGCSGIATSTVTVRPLPTVTVNNPIICKGTNAILTAVGASTYKWGDNIFASNPRSVSPNITTQYEVTGTDTYGCENSALSTVTVNQNPIVDAGNDTTICKTVGIASLSVTPNNASSYLWNPTTGLSNSSIFNPTASPASTSTYKVTVIDVNGCSGTDDVIVTISPEVIADAGDDVIICEGNSTVLNASGGTTYKWSPASSLSADNVSSPTATPTNTTNYTLTVYDNIGCSDFDDVKVTVNPYPTSNFNVVSPICQVNNTTITYLGNGTSTADYTWNFDGGTIVSGSDQGPYVINWNTSGTHQISLYVEQAECKSPITTQNVIVNPMPTSTFSVESPICIYDSSKVVYTGTADVNAIYNWVFDGATATPGTGQGPHWLKWTSSGIYTIELAVSQNNCPSMSTQHTIKVTEKPTSDFTVESPICIYNQSTVVYTGNADPSATYHFNFDGGSSSLGSGPGPYSISWNSAGVYNLSLYVTENGCESEITTQPVTVNGRPIIDFIADPTEGCQPLYVQFADLSPDVTSRTWNFGDPTSTANSSDMQNPSHVYLEPGGYDVSLSINDSKGCTNALSMPDYISVYPRPTAEFEFWPDIATIENPYYKFSPSGSSSNVSGWEWHFGDFYNPIPDTSNEETPDYTYHNSGSYNVTLVVSTEKGCKDTIEKEVIVKDIYTFYIPNAFTPNGDGDNEFFGPKGIGIDSSSFEMFIYDRWGEMIYSTNDIQKPWNGRFLGTQKACKQDVYYWLIYVKEAEGVKHSYQGTVTLIK